MKLLRSENSSPYCVPAALALLTGCHVDEICNLLTEKYLGDQPISGIYLGPPLALLRETFKFTVEQIPVTNLTNLRKVSRALGQTFFCVFHAHVGVMFDGKYYDNKFPEGTSLTPSYHLETAYLVTR